MAKHSSFKNLVALETCQNFFLIAGISTEASLNEPCSQESTGAEISPSAEDSIGTDLPQQKVNAPIPHCEEITSTLRFED